MAGERTPEEIQRDIEQARASLADTVDQLAYRTNPKRLTAQARESLLERARSPQGQKVLAGAGLLLAVLVVRRLRRH